MVLGDAFSKLSGLHTANLSWQTRVGKPKLVCVNGTKTGGKRVCKLLASNRNVFADCYYAVHTPTWVCQHEFANLSLPCEGRFRHSKQTEIVMAHKKRKTFNNDSGKYKILHVTFLRFCSNKNVLLLCK